VADAAAADSVFVATSWACQGGELVGTMFEGISLQLEAAAQATSMVELFARKKAGRSE
jgi:hypothetical protein